MTFEEWWGKNEKQYSSDALHMSEYHMASIVWEAATAVEREECAKLMEHLSVDGLAGFELAQEIRKRSDGERL